MHLHQSRQICLVCSVVYKTVIVFAHYTQSSRHCRNNVIVRNAALVLSLFLNDANLGELFLPQKDFLQSNDIILINKMMFFSVQDAVAPEGNVVIVWRHRLKPPDDNVDGGLPGYHKRGSPGEILQIAVNNSVDKVA